MANVYSLTVATGLSAQITAGTAFPAVNSPSQLRPSDQSYASGTATGSIDQLYMSQIVATTGGSSIQLNGAALTDPIGGTFAPVRLDAIGVYNAGTATVGVAGALISAAFGSGASIPVKPSGRLVYDDPSAAGLAVGSGTNSVITFTSSSGTAAVQVLLAGRSV